MRNLIMKLSVALTLGAALFGVRIARADVEVPAPDEILGVAQTGSPTALWATLEHGERVVCMACIPVVEARLYDGSTRAELPSDHTAREIAAWWLRKRPFGFGPVFVRTIGVLAGDANPLRRAFAAAAVGEFLDAAGRVPLQNALASDPDPRVRVAAAKGLMRLNNPLAGPSLSAAFGDPIADVRLAAIDAAMRLMGFFDTPGVVALLTDADPRVRARAVIGVAELGGVSAAAAVAGALLADADANVRARAAWALMELRATTYTQNLRDALADSSPSVRDAARIALRGITAP